MDTHNYTGGRYIPIAELIANKSHVLEAWGNSREGYGLYLASLGDGTSQSGCWVSERFRRLRDLRQAARDHYGAGVAVPIGRNW